MFGKIKLRKDEINILYPSIKKAYDLLGWKPKSILILVLKEQLNLANIDDKKISVIVNFHNGENILRNA